MESQDNREPIDKTTAPSSEPYDYTFVQNTATVAVYDDMRMAPKMIQINPAPTADFIEHLASCINDEKNKLGGKIPYAAIREVSENFIHAQFTEAVVSILDGGNTIRFCDQGPGIENKDKAILPGFTSANKEQKAFIRGVGSGLPLVKEYLDFSGGRIEIDDNMKHGAVVTISLMDKPAEKPAEQAPSAPQPIAPAPVAQAAQMPQPTAPAPIPAQPAVPLPALSEREIQAMSIFASEGALGVKDLAELQDLATSSAHALMSKMEKHGLIANDKVSKKRMLTEYGNAVWQHFDR